MKKIIYWLFMLPLFALLNGCDDTDTIIFDDELPQFEIKANAILLEVIMPKGSAADDEYYIVGDFNGGAEAAVQHPIILPFCKQKNNSLKCRNQGIFSRNPCESSHVTIQSD